MLNYRNATVTVTKFDENGVTCDAFQDKLHAVISMIDYGDLGGGCVYGCPEHMAALEKVQEHLSLIREKIAEHNEKYGTAPEGFKLPPAEPQPFAYVPLPNGNRVPVAAPVQDLVFHAPEKLVVESLVEALEGAKLGLDWYGDRNPGQRDGSDDEMLEQIDIALDLAAQYLRTPAYLRGGKPMHWPKGREAERQEDMGSGKLRIVLDSDNDVCVGIWGPEGFVGLEFCNGMAGGGKSPRTREALIGVMVAMEQDAKG